MDPHRANLQPNLFLLGSRLRFNSTPAFLWVTFNRTLSFSKHVSSLKAKFFPHFKALRCICASSWSPLRSLSLFCIIFFFGPFSLTLHPNVFFFLSVTNVTKLERLYRAVGSAITGCLLSSPTPLLLSEASLPPLRVSLTHFLLSFYDRALCLPTSFTISGLARLGVKPRLQIVLESFCVHSLLMLPFASPRRLFLFALSVLLGIFLRSPWSPPFLPHAFALVLLSLAKVRLSPILALFPLMIWCSGQTALFLFLLARAAPVSLPTALSVVLRPLFPFQQAQYVPVFPLKPARFCKLLAAFGSTNKSAISLL